MRHKYILWLIALSLSACNLFAQKTTKVTAIQYYYNTDPGVNLPGNGAIQSVTDTSNYNQTLNLILPTLPLGFNTLFVRAKDEYGRWSVAERSMFYVTPLNVTDSITAYEYFFDTDNGIGNNTAYGAGVFNLASATVNLSQQINISIPSLMPAGFHTLFFRTKSTSGTWSIAERSMFYVTPLNVTDSITAYEYFFDTDNGIGNNTAYGAGVFNLASATVNLNQQINISIPSLMPAGFHTLFFRTKSTSGRWSIAERSLFYINENNNTQTVTALEYYFDNDPGIGNGVAYPVTASSVINITASFTSPCLTNGNHYLYFRGKDEFGRWSIIGRDTIAVTAGVNPFVVSPAGPISVCANDSVTLTTTLVPGIVYQWKLNGNPIPGANGISYVVHNTGVYSVGTSCGASSASSNNVTINVQPLNTFYRDFDGDGFGNIAVTTTTCSQPVGYVSNSTDCNDSSSIIHAPILYYVDADHDNYGSTTTALLCEPTPPQGYSTNNTDCNDNNILIHAEVIYYADADGDGYGSTTTGSFCQLTPPAGYVTNNTDCNDASALEHPGQVWYIDVDGDHYGTGALVTQCLRPANGYVVAELIATTGDCNDALVSVHPGATEVCNGIDDNCNGSIDEGVKITFYQDADGDTYGNNAVTQLACIAPTGYVVNNTDCNDGSAIEHPGQIWYIDADGDGYGRNGPSIIQCLRPVNGFIATELTATTGDCNDNNASINPGSRYFTFTGNSNFTNSIIAPQIGTSYTTFHVEADYFDATNALPVVNYPRLQLDYEGNGIFTDPNDRIYLMSQTNPSDVTTSNGKRYSIDINGLPTGTNWTARIFTNDAGCTTTFGPFNNPDVFELPNLVIFANDINITPVHPNPGDNITVSATVHNASDYDAVNFYVHLTNQYDSINFTYPNILVSNLPAHTATTVTWTIVTPPVPAFVPMEVRIDETNVISETNELDNRAIRPFVNGNYNLPGGIVCDAQVTPFASNSAASNFPVISGNVHYYGLAVPLQDSSVAGATVSFTIVETGITFTGYTGSNGFYNIPFPGPIDTGLYHINVSITDYTLTGTCSTTFRILPCINLPDLTASVSLGYTGGVPGNSFSGSITVTNSGCAPVGASILGITQSGGTPTLSNINVGALLAGQSQTFTFGPIIVANPGSFSICAFADAAFTVDEGNEANNSSCPASYSYGSGGGGGSGGGYGNLGSFGFGGGGGGYVCNANNFTIALRNAGTAAVGSFTVQVLISKNNVLQNTLTQVVSGIAALSNVYVTFPYNYTSVGAGNYTYEVNTDLYNTVVESDEGNNISFYSNTLLPCKPNLTFIECDSITVSPANVTTGGTLTLTSTVHNNGIAAAIGPIAVRFNYSNGGVYTAQYNGNIAINTSAPVSVSAPVPPTGTTVYATIDPLAQISETSEGDNLSPTWKLCYDFRIDTLCGAKSNMWQENYNLFETLNLRAGISNLGLLQADTVKVRFQISGPGIIGTLNLGDAIVTNVGRTCKCPLQAYLPGGFVFTLNGLYTVTITADPDNKYAECSEGNNVMVTYIQVSDLPEYRILSQYINPSLLNPDVGQPVTFDVTYENMGREDLNDSMRLNFLADNIQLNSIYPVPGLPKNAHATLPLSAWSSNVPGIHILRAVIDADSVVDESNELNNEGTRSIVVGQSANLYFQVFQPSTLTPSLYQNLSITTRIGNSGDLPCEADVQYYYINGNDTLPISTLQHVVVPANDSVNLTLFNWTVISISTKLVGKIINSASLEYTYDDNITSVKIGSYGLTISTTPVTCPNTNGTATAVATGGVSPYSYLWSNSSGSVGSGSVLTTVAGNYTVTVTDNSGQSVTGTTTITTIPDNVNPVITCPATANIVADAGLCTSSSPIGIATATDNCSVSSIVASPAGPYPVGTTTVTWTATDASGNTATCTQTVNVTDTENPSITCPATANITADAGLCTSSASIGTATATDNCAGATVAASPVGPYPVGTTTVTWTATDASGNTATCTQTVNVTDTENPVITCPATANITADAGLCTSSASIGTATATDNCAGATVAASPVGPYPVGTTTVTWTATDASGNTATCTQTVNVTDTENPVITCPATANITADAGLCTSSASIGTAIATDNCAGATVAASPAGPYAVGTTTVTWTATDASGNTATCTQTVNVTDNENPVAVCQNITVDLDINHTYTLTASEINNGSSDNCGVASVSISAGQTTFGCSDVGNTFPVTLLVTDIHGNTATCVANVTVTAITNPCCTSPVMVCAGSLAVNADAGLCNATITNTQLLDQITSVTGNPAPTVTFSPAAGSFPIGTTPVTATATNSCGSPATCTFNVVVTDTQNPVITCPATANLTANAGLCTSNGFIGMATATDNCSVSSIVASPAGPYPVGTTIVTWTATDASGNTATCTQTVNVTDTENPVITCPANISVCDPGSPIVNFNVTATDNCSIQSIVSTPASGSIFPIGTTTVNSVATDVNGNTTTCSFTVTISTPSTAPTSATSDAPFNNICAGNSTNLTVNGGSLGTGASWKWYSGSCGGTPLGTGTSISVSPTVTTTYFVRAEGACNTTTCASVTITVSNLPLISNAIVPFTGMPNNVCNGTTATLSIPSVSRATFYVWDAPSGSYFNGNPLNVSPYTTATPSVTVTFGNPSGSLYNVGVQAGNACGLSLRQSQKVRGLISVPASISGSLTACANTSVSYSTPAVTGATSYLWAITGDATVTGTGTTVTVNFGSTWTSGTLCVSAQTTCYTSAAKCITISKNAAALGVISGTFTACPNTTITYSVTASAGAASYTWTLPAGSSGSSTTNSIAVTFGSGYNAVGSICVSATSICGVTSAPKCKTVAPGLPSQPSSISGPTNGLCGQSVVYTCPSQGVGVTYNWTVPAGANVVSGQGSTSINVQYGTFTTGTICVTASNSCGSSIARCITVKGAPASPLAITATPSSWCANTQGIEFNANVSNVTGTYTLSWSFPTSPIATYVFGGGNSTSLLMDWLTGTGNINVTASNACGSGTKTSTWSSSCRESEVGTVSMLTVSPNPTTGVVNINYTASKGNTTINVLDLAGRVVMTETTTSVDGANNTQLDMSKLAKGAYMLSVQSTQGNKQVKVVVE